MLRKTILALAASVAPPTGMRLDGEAQRTAVGRLGVGRGWTAEGRLHQSRQRSGG